MADDVKIQLGIDVEALQRSAAQATNILTQAFQGGIGANVLGNGLAPTQGPSQQQQGPNSIAAIINSLQRINQTLLVGFNAIAGGVYLGGGGGGGGGGAGGGGGGIGMGGPGGAANLAQAGPGAGVGGGGFGIASQILGRAGDLAGALMPSSMRMFMGGKYSTDVMGFAHNLVSQIPIVGRLLGAVTGPFHQVMQQNDEFKNMQYETFRDSGEDAMDTFTNLWTDDDKRERFVKQYGFSRGETQQLVGSGYRRGIGGGPGNNAAIETILNMQGRLGLGQEAAETMGGLRRGGLKPGQETEAMASAIGVAVATGLERGRWNEMLSMWQRAAQSSIDTDITLKGVVSQQQAIGSMGGRFLGDTPAMQSMDQALRGAASNDQSPLALRGAMRLTGGDYFGSTARMARAGENPDPDLQENILDQLMSMSGVRAWLAMPDGPDADRALDRIAGVAATLGTGLSQLKIAALLKAKKSTQGPLFKPLSAEAAEVGRQQIGSSGASPETAMGPRRSQSEAQRPSGISSIQEIGSVGSSVRDQVRQSQADELVRQAIAHPLAGDPFGTGRGSGSRMAPMSGGAASSGYQGFVMQKFGSPLAGRSPHPGVDLAFPPGTAVTAPVDGVITHIRDGSGMEAGKAVHIRADDGSEWKLYHIDPKTFPAGLRVGQRIAKGTPLGKTFDFPAWKDTGVRTHLHVGHVGASGALLDPMGPGGISPGALTGGASPSAASLGGSGGSSGLAGGAASHVTADVHVHVHQDQSGRPVARVRAPTPAITSSPGQLFGGTR